jgi:hypothetical protein
VVEQSKLRGAKKSAYDLVLIEPTRLCEDQWIDARQLVVRGGLNGVGQRLRDGRRDPERTQLRKPSISDLGGNRNSPAASPTAFRGQAKPSTSVSLGSARSAALISRPQESL